VFRPSVGAAKQEFRGTAVPKPEFGNESAE
jgi:hypothetical protein